MNKSSSAGMCMHSSEWKDPSSPLTPEQFRAILFSKYHTATRRWLISSPTHLFSPVPKKPMSTAGAVYLAHERQWLDDCPPEAPEPKCEAKPTRWPLTDCMNDRAVVEWWVICREFGLTH